jgi:hypothetical protein
MIYHIFYCNTLYRRNKPLQAEIRGGYPVISSSEWCNPNKPFNLPVYTFEFDGSLLMPDNIDTGGGIFNLYSPRLVEAIRGFPVQFETFPVKIIDSVSKEILSESYVIFRLREIEACLDPKKTLVNKPVIAQKLMDEPKYMFRNKDLPLQVIIHKDIKDCFETLQISGCRYVEILDNDKAASLFPW